MQDSNCKLALERIPVDAPFDMADIGIPDFAACPVFTITDFGAESTDQHANHLALERAIAAAHSAGGGTVRVPAGTWPCKKIHLKSFVNLHLEQGATLLFSARPEDYLPAVHTSWEGIECYNYSPLVYAFECEQVAITGAGKLQAQLDVWRDWYARPQAHMQALVRLYHLMSKGVDVAERQMAYEGANLRPHFVQFNRCRHVRIEGIAIEDSPFWVLHGYLCRDVLIRGVKVKALGHNNDGVDPEMTQNMLIEDCVFDQGDDAISVKAGRNHDGWRLATPSKNIVMRNCRIHRAMQLLAVGSELSGGIENILIEHCSFADGEEVNSSGFGNVLFVKTNERRGGYVKNIFMKNIQAEAIAGGALCVATDVLYQWRDLVPTYEQRLTRIAGLYMENISLGKARFVARISDACSRRANESHPLPRTQRCCAAE